MKKTIALIAAAMALPAAAEAANGKYYVSLTGEYILSAETDGDLTANAGSADFSSDYSDGLGALIAVGTNFNDNVRLEAEGGYRSLNGDTTSITLAGTTYTVDSSDVDAKAFSLMGNAYFDIPTQSKFSPYVGAGLGWAHETEEGGNAIAYQLMTGVNYKVSDEGTLFAGYRYLGTGDFEYTYNVTGLGLVNQESSLDAHALNIGYRFSF